MAAKITFPSFPDVIQVDDRVFTFGCLDEDAVAAIEAGDRDMDWLTAGYQSEDGYTYYCDIIEANRLYAYYRRNQQGE